MADIRINALATTAASTASDDFIAVDGSANGTRKLNAYSPTFGGNLTVSGSGTVNSPSGTSSGLLVKAFNTAAGNIQQWADFQTSTGLTLARFLRGNGASGYDANGLSIDSFEGLRVNLNALGGSGGAFTIAGGNLTVSGTGTSTISGNLNLNGTDKSILLNGASTQFSREIDVRIAGDTEGRLLIRGGGSLLWGDGAGGYDSTLARTAANMLTVTGGLTTSGNLTVSGGTVTSGTGTLTLNSSANTVVLQSAGTTALTLDSSQNATFAKLVGIGGVPVVNTSLILRGLSTTVGAAQAGIDQQTTFSASATTSGIGVSSILVTTAASFTMASGAAFQALTPILGSGSSVTTNRGLYIANQGTSGITNAYGIDIAAQSGAATTNIGLRNLGATVLSTPASAVTLADNSTMTFELTSNTSLTIKVRGTDGTTRSVALTLS